MEDFKRCKCKWSATCPEYRQTSAQSMNREAKNCPITNLYREQEKSKEPKPGPIPEPKPKPEPIPKPIEKPKVIQKVKRVR